MEKFTFIYAPKEKKKEDPLPLYIELIPPEPLVKEKSDSEEESRVTIIQVF